MAKREFHLVNFDARSEKLRFLEGARRLKGVHEVSIRQIRPKRSTQANGYYWAAYIPGWLDWLRESSGEPWITKEQAHKSLVKHVLGTKDIINKETGEVIDEMIPETHLMDKHEFTEYLDRAAAFLASFCDLVVLPSEDYFDAPERGESGTRK